jgi:nitrite reductase/ring-hydroxylating ferredoxin subunit
MIEIEVRCPQLPAGFGAVMAGARADGARGEVAGSSGIARAKGVGIQELLDTESLSVPWVLRQDEFTDLGSEDMPVDRYFSAEFFAAENTRLWPRVWQLACFEQDVPNVGDSIVYEILEWSFVVVRVAPDQIKGYYNSCLHRGRQLLVNSDGPVCVPELRCPFHGFTWNLDGSFKGVPAPIAWDFPHVDPERFVLPEVRVETWDGFVFLNMDPEAKPLMEFLGDLPHHLERWSYENRWKSVHVAKIIPANWKVVHETFLETYHVFATHPQIFAGLLGGDGSNCEYDIYDGGRQNFSRMVIAPLMPNPNLPYEVTEQELIDELFIRGSVQTEDGFTPEGEPPKLPEGMTARQYLAESARRAGLGRVGGRDLTDLELTAGIQYFVFPNIYPWAAPTFYRVRPYGEDAERSIMEIIFLTVLPEGAERPPAVPVHWLDETDDWTAAPELGGLAELFNQDTINMEALQRGLKTSRKGAVTLSKYQDIRIRHFHRLLDAYLDNA